MLVAHAHTRTSIACAPCHIRARTCALTHTIACALSHTSTQACVCALLVCVKVCTRANLYVLKARGRAVTFNTYGFARAPCCIRARAPSRIRARAHAPTHTSAFNTYKRARVPRRIRAHAPSRIRARAHASSHTSAF